MKGENIVDSEQGLGWENLSLLKRLKTKVIRRAEN